MATTKPKESCGLGKERKISVTIPNNTSTKRTPKSSPRGIISSTDPKFSSSSSSSNPSLSILPEKHVPNYLKSTASSRHDHNNFKPITKTKSAPAPIPEGKPSLNRRRSFDKPPPTAPRLEKPFRSPGPRSRPAHVPIRSSSFGAKPSTTTTTIGNSTKPSLLERSSSKISKVGGRPQQPIQSLKTSSSNVKKSLRRESSNVAASASASPEMVPKTKNAVEYIDQSPSFVLGVNEEDLKKIECELDPYLPDPMPEFDKQLRIDEEEKKAVLEKDEVDTEILKVVVAIKEVEEKETPEIAETEMSSENRERNEDKHEEEEKPKIIEVEKEEVIESEENTKNKNDEEKSETEGVLDDGESCKDENDHNSTPKAAETTEKEDEGSEKTGAAAAKARQGGAGRKESPAMYNDVIEETASKLLEKRKNKVRALAGAFQTVIDYESSSK